jgi:hypothetical protein
MIRQLTHALDSVNIQWRLWIIGYSREHQFTLMRNLGIDVLSTLQWSLLSTGLVLIMMLIVIFKITRQGRLRLTTTQRLYQNFCKKLSRIGIIRRAYEGPMDFATRATRNRPDLASQIKAISDLYIALRYARISGEKAQQRLLARHIHQFKPRR